MGRFYSIHSNSQIGFKAMKNLHLTFQTDLRTKQQTLRGFGLTTLINAWLSFGRFTKIYILATFIRVRKGTNQRHSLGGARHKGHD
jgi:hypothetical protein